MLDSTVLWSCCPLDSLELLILNDCSSSTSISTSIKMQLSLTGSPTNPRSLTDELKCSKTNTDRLADSKTFESVCLVLVMIEYLRTEDEKEKKAGEMKKNEMLVSAG